MNTKLIMTSTAILLAVLGLSLTFAPDNVIVLLGINDSIIIRLILQLLGAAFYAFAMLNWMAKGAVIGGIYNRPIAVANLTHFLIGGIALTKAVLSNHQLPLFLSVIAGIYSITACVYGFVISHHPGKQQLNEKVLKRYGLSSNQLIAIRRYEPVQYVIPDIFG